MALVITPATVCTGVQEKPSADVGTTMIDTPLVPVGPGPAGQPYVVGVLDQAGPHLLAVDHVVVAVPGCRGAQRRQVGAGLTASKFTASKFTASKSTASKFTAPNACLARAKHHPGSTRTCSCFAPRRGVESEHGRVRRIVRPNKTMPL